MIPASSRANAKLLRLHHRRKELAFGPGTYTVGRHASCDIVLDSTHVSRRHAQISVSRNGVQLRDLDSANGVYLNGVRLGPVPARLRDGDRLLIGNEQLDVQLETPERPISDVSPLSRPNWIVPVEESGELIESERSSPGTRSVSFFDMVGRIVDRALAENRIDEAHTMLAPQLRNVLSDARAGRPIDAPTREGALRYALALAKAQRGGAWLDFSLELLTALAWAPAGALASDLEQTVSAAGTIDETRLNAYATALEAAGDRLTALRVTQWARRGPRG